MPEDMLTISQAVAQFQAQGVTDTKLRHWIRTGRITGYKNRFDNTIAVKAQDVQAVIDSMNQFEPIQGNGEK